MESNITNQQFWRPDAPLAEPHFDEEATLLSARPVVPISDLTRKGNFSRPWVSGFALAGALLLGVLATAFYYSRFPTTEPQSVSGSEAVSSGVEGVTSDSDAVNQAPNEATEPTESFNSLVDSNKLAKAKTQAASVSWSTRRLKPPKATLKKQAQPRATMVDDQGPDSEYDARDERRAARREAKERQRETRERRVGRRYDELLRIREIFEGPSRP